MLSSILKTNRARRQWTIRELSERTGIAISRLSSYENGKNTPRAGALQKIADAFELTVEQLLHGELTTSESIIGSKVITDAMFKARVEECLALNQNSKTAIYYLLDQLLEKEQIVKKVRQLTKM